MDIPSSLAKKNLYRQSESCPEPEFFNICGRLKSRLSRIVVFQRSSVILCEAYIDSVYHVQVHVLGDRVSRAETAFSKINLAIHIS
jgi:hypothetical protein